MPAARLQRPDNLLDRHDGDPGRHRGQQHRDESREHFLVAPALGAGKHGAPHVESRMPHASLGAVALESVLQGAPIRSDLSRALDISRERRQKRSAMAGKGRSDPNADDPSVTREVIGGDCMRHPTLHSGPP